MSRSEARWVMATWYNRMVDRFHRPPEPPFYVMNGTEIVKENGRPVLSFEGEEALRQLRRYTKEAAERAMARVMLEPGYPTFGRVLQSLREELKSLPPAEGGEPKPPVNSWPVGTWVTETIRGIAAWGKITSPGKIDWYRPLAWYVGDAPEAFKRLVHTEGTENDFWRSDSWKRMTPEEIHDIEAIIQALAAEAGLMNDVDVVPLVIKKLARKAFGKRSEVRGERYSSAVSLGEVLPKVLPGQNIGKPPPDDKVPF